MKWVGKLTQHVLVVGTYDTKGAELSFIRDCISSRGLDVTTVDVSALHENMTSDVSSADIPPECIAQYHPRQLPMEQIFHRDRGMAINELLQCLAQFVTEHGDIAGIIGVGGSGGTALLAPAMRTLPIGVPKLLVSTVASGNTKPYVCASDLTMMYSVADIAGLNVITRDILSNAAYAIAGMCMGRQQANMAPASITSKPALGMTMFGVTSPCVTAVKSAFESDFDCLIFHATGTGGNAMECLAQANQLAGIIDLTTTEITDLLCGGVFSAGEARLDSIISTKLPYLGSLGAAELVNFGTPDTVPASYRHRRFHQHNPQVTLMRTNSKENVLIGRWIAEKLNRCEGPVRFLLPEKGLSLMSTVNQPFYDPEADAVLFETLEDCFCETATRRLVRVPFAINDIEFSQIAVESFIEIIT